MALSQFRPTVANEGGSTKKPTTPTTTPVSNAGTQKYIEQMQYAANAVKNQSALDQLKAAQDNSTAKEKAEHAGIQTAPATTPAVNNNANKSAPANTDVASKTNGGLTGLLSWLSTNYKNGNLGGLANVANNVVSNIVNKVQTPATSTAPATETTVGTVQQNYQNLMNAANDRLKQAYEYQQNQLATAKDNALREAWVKQQMVERGYPEQLSAAGINGGAAQAVLARNNADYAKQRTSIYNNYLNNLANAGQTYQQGIYGSNENFLANMAAYQQAFEEMKKNYEYDEALMRLSASLNK